ncbi:MFS family permease [Catenulispora sp. GAS73]
MARRIGWPGRRRGAALQDSTQHTADTADTVDTVDTAQPTESHSARATASSSQLPDSPRTELRKSSGAQSISPVQPQQGPGAAQSSSQPPEPPQQNSATAHRSDRPQPQQTSRESESGSQPPELACPESQPSPSTGSRTRRLTAMLADTAPLRESPAFRRLWLSSLCSSFGGQMTTVAVLFQIWHSTNSAAWTGAIGLAQAVPLIAFGLFAGALADRLDRRRYFMACTVGQGACSALLATQALLGTFPVLAVLFIVAGQSVFGAGAGPTARTFLPHLVRTEHMGSAIALNRISFQGSMMVGPALGGVVVGVAGVGACYLIDTLSFGVALYGAFRLPRLAMRSEQAPRPGLRGVADGLSYLVHAAPVRGALLTDLATTVLTMPISLFPLLNAERFGNNPRTLGLFLTAIAVGGVVASVFSGTFTRLPRPGAVMLLGSTVWAAALLMLGLVANAWLGLACLAVAGAADTLAVVSRSTLVQLNTPNEMLGRVAAAEQIAGQAGPELGNLRAGLTAAATSGQVALVSGGMLCLAALAVIVVKTPQLREFTRPVAVETPQPVGVA